MAFSLNKGAREALADAMNEGMLYGVNANTADKDLRAWEMWEHVCQMHGTSPLRTAEDARTRPERNAHLLAVLMLHAFAYCRPRTKGALFIKPKSALAYPLAVIRIFARWAVTMPSYKYIKSSLAHLCRLYIAHHGPYSLVPRRAEPMKFAMVLKIDAFHIDSSAYSDHDAFMFKGLNRTLWPTGVRLASAVAHKSEEIMYFTRKSLTLSVGGVTNVDPTPEQLRAMRPGIDYFQLAPSREKPDQWGEIHCAYPMTLTLQDEPGNAASWLRDLELRLPCRGEARKNHPLFADKQGMPYTHAFLDKMLKWVLTRCFGEGVARLFTWHSYRSGLLRQRCTPLMSLIP